MLYLYNLKHLSDLRKIFYFSHEIETFSQTFFMNVNRKKKSGYIPSIMKVFLSLREMAFLFLLDISENIEIFTSFSSTYFNFGCS